MKWHGGKVKIIIILLEIDGTSTYIALIESAKIQEQKRYQEKHSKSTTYR